MSRDLKQERRLLAVLGVALAASGLLRYSTQNEMTRLNLGLLIGGGVLILASLAMSYREIGALASQRSSRLGTNTLALTLIVIVILGIVNFLGFRHHARVDLTTEKLYTLSGQTRNVLKGLNQDVQILHFVRQPDSDFTDMATDYANLSSHIHYRDVDPNLSPEIAAQYNVTQLNQVVVATAKQNEKLSDANEQSLTNAILKVTRSNTKTICFSQGHGERDIMATDDDGYATMVHVLDSEGYQTKGVNLVSSGGEVPSDCSVIVVAGPQQPFLPQESQILSAYLDNGGKALFMLDSQTDPKLDDVLQKWNITLGTNVVIDASGAGRLFGTGPAVPMVVDYGQSPITSNFTGTMTFFPLARTVTVANKSAQQPATTELLKTSERSFTVPNLKTKEIRYDPKTDTVGPLTLGVTAVRTSAPSAPGAAAGKEDRLVVIGDSYFATNKWSALQRNGDLFLNTVHWLAEDEDLISIQPKSQTNRRIILTEMQQKEMFWLSLIFLPGIVLLSGVMLWVRRR